MTHEEEELLPQFIATEGVTPDYLMQLGRVFETAKLIALSMWASWRTLGLPHAWLVLLMFLMCTCAAVHLPSGA
jgi:hypothetical protein